MRKRTTTRRAAVLRASALLLLACAAVGCSGGRRELTLQLEYRLGPTEKPAEALLAAHAVIERRVALIAPDARVLSVEPDRILVQVPELDAATMGVLRETMSLLGSLEFRLVAPGNSKAHKTWQDEKKAPEGYTEYTVTGSEKVLVCDHCEMSGQHIATALALPAERKGSQSPRVGLTFTAAGEREFARVTGDNVGERLAIVLDTQRSSDGKVKDKGSCYSAPVIQSRIFGNAVIEGDFTLEEAKALAAALASGPLPAPLVFDKTTPLSKNPPRGGADKKDK